MSPELEFGNYFDPIDNYEILTKNECTEIGIGLIFDEQNETFSMFIIMKQMISVFGIYSLGYQVVIDQTMDICHIL